MTISLNPAAAAESSTLDKEKQKQVSAAKDFEALLISQMLRSIREDGSSWLGTGDDQASSAAFGLGEEQLAKSLASSGGLGLSKVIASGLSHVPKSVRVP